MGDTEFHHLVSQINHFLETTSKFVDSATQTIIWLGMTIFAALCCFNFGVLHGWGRIAYGVCAGIGCFFTIINWCSASGHCTEYKNAVRARAKAAKAPKLNESEKPAGAHQVNIV